MVDGKVDIVAMMCWIMYTVLSYAELLHATVPVIYVPLSILSVLEM